MPTPASMQCNQFRRPVTLPADYHIELLPRPCLRSCCMPKPAFRYDINGLRAYAVVAVLLFHFQLPGFGAGFFGVDMFFVISGFLMTGIILRGLEQGNFSLQQFYLARLRRIVPA